MNIRDKQVVRERLMKTHLSGQALISAIGQQKADDAIVILLGRHVEWREAILRLDVD